jgi:hypothetical protein
MITYSHASRRPAAFNSMFGFSVAAFDALYVELALAHQERLIHAGVTRKTGMPRQRKPGAGRRFNHDLRDRLLLTLFWLRVYPTLEVLGFFFSLDKTSAEDNLKDILATLETLTSFALEHPEKSRKKLRSVQQVMDAFPDVTLVLDAKEQRIQRPKNKKKPTQQDAAEGSQAPAETEPDIQKPYYSGKKKCHTLKTQIGVRPDGSIVAVSGSVPGGATHDITLLRQSGWLDQLDQTEAAMMDKGYDGITNDYPDKTLYLPYKARRGHPLTEEEKDYNRFLSKYRIVVEHTNAQLNVFQVLVQTYRHCRDKHSQIVRIVAGLVNRRIAHKPLKTYAAV